jgi:hypothetical protein
MISIPLTDTINVLPTNTTNAFCSSANHIFRKEIILLENKRLKIM